MLGLRRPHCVDERILSDLHSASIFFDFRVRGLSSHRAARFAQTESVSFWFAGEAWPQQPSQPDERTRRVGFPRSRQLSPLGGSSRGRGQSDPSCSLRCSSQFGSPLEYRRVRRQLSSSSYFFSWISLFIVSWITRGRHLVLSPRSNIHTHTHRVHWAPDRPCSVSLAASEM